MRLKLTMPERAAATVTLADGATVGDIAAAAAAAFALPRTVRLALATVYPLRQQVALVALEELAGAAARAPAGSVGIQPGSVVDVRVVAAPAAAAVVPPAPGAPLVRAINPPPPAPPAPPAPLPPAAAAPAPWACPACTLLNAAPLSACDVCGGPRPARLERHAVPADNACLFTALAYLAGGGTMRGGPAMRARVVAHLLARPGDFPEALLGQPPAAYAAHMARPETWGGGLEMRAASDLLGLEVVAVCVKTGSVSRFGEERAYSRRVLLLYDGIHFDALHRPGSPPELDFATADQGALDEALAVAAAARAARAYTDLAGFALACGVCGAGLTGERAAREHARDTGHANFVECAPLTR